MKKTGHAIRALGRMSLLQKSLSFGDSSSRSSRSRQGSFNSDTTGSSSSKPGTSLDSAASLETSLELQEPPPEGTTVHRQSPERNNNLLKNTKGESLDYDPPRFVRKMKDVEVTPGEQARFRVTISGDPAPQVTWYRENEPITEGTKYDIEQRGESASLYINNCQESDDAMYECRAENPAGVATCCAELSLNLQ